MIVDLINSSFAYFRFRFFQELVNSKDSNLTIVNEAVESGERLYPNTAADGREIIRHELRSLKVL